MAMIIFCNRLMIQMMNHLKHSKQMILMRLHRPTPAPASIWLDYKMMKMTPSPSLRIRMTMSIRMTMIPIEMIRVHR